MNPDDLTWCNLPNGEPGIVVWYWNELGERISDPMFAIGIVAADRFRKFHSFKIDEKTFEEVMLQ